MRPSLMAFPSMWIHTLVINLGGCRSIQHKPIKIKVNNYEAKGKLNLPCIIAWNLSKAIQNCHKKMANHLIHRGLYTKEST